MTLAQNARNMQHTGFLAPLSMFSSSRTCSEMASISSSVSSIPSNSALRASRRFSAILIFERSIVESCRLRLRLWVDIWLWDHWDESVQSSHHCDAKIELRSHDPCPFKVSPLNSSTTLQIICMSYPQSTPAYTLLLPLLVVYPLAQKPHLAHYVRTFSVRLGSYSVISSFYSLLGTALSNMSNLTSLDIFLDHTASWVMHTRDDSTYHRLEHFASSVHIDHNLVHFFQKTSALLELEVNSLALPTTGIPSLWIFPAIRNLS